MFTNDIEIYGEYGIKLDKLKESGLFERNLDVFLAAGVIGIIYGKKGKKEIAQTSKKIGPGQLNGEISRIKYLASLAYLVENSNMKGNETTEKELLRHTFGDWFGESDEDSLKKYKLFELYALGGIEILHDKIISNNTDIDSYFENFYNFIDDINKLEIHDDMDRTFAGVLNI